MNEDTGALLRRVENLERQNRWMKWSGLVVLLGIASVLFYGATASKKVIESSGFLLVDENGETCAVLGFVNGEPGLVLADKNGKNRVFLAIVNGCPNLILSDENGTARTILGEGPGLSLSDENGKIRAILGLMNGEPGLGLYDENKETLFSAP